MKKLKLDVEMLAVESFGTSHEESEARGTVQGQSVILLSPWCGPSVYCTVKTALEYTCPPV
jgi:hypothetical protein